MGSRDDSDVMAEACITTGQLVMAHGSPALQQAMRIVLFTLGREIARREARRTQQGGRTCSGAPFERIIGKRPG